MNFAIRLKELREKAGISQAQLAEIIGVGVSTVGMWESTKRAPSAKALNKLVAYFDCPIAYILGETDIVNNQSIHIHSLSSLAEDEKQLLDLFRSMTHAQQIRFIAYGEGITGAESPKIKA